MKPLTVAILAGGLATRLQPDTASVPKSLLPVAGRPFIHWQLELLASQGIDQVVLCIGHLGEQIRRSVGDACALGLSARYSHDGHALLGTGGALRHALPLLGPEFFVLYGDSYLPCSLGDVQAAWRECNAAGLLTVFRNENRWEPSNVLLRAGRVAVYDKWAPRAQMRHIDYGLAILSARTLAERPEGSDFDLADLYRELALRGELAALEMPERYFEIGSRPGRAATERFLTRSAPA